MFATARLRQKHEGLDSLLPWAAVIEDGIVLTKAGELIACWSYRGLDLETASDAEMDAASARLNALFTRFGAGWMFHFDLMRVPIEEYPDSQWDSPTLELIDQERATTFRRAERTYESHYIISVTYSPPITREARAQSFFFDVDETDNKDPPFASQAVAYFRHVITEVEDRLGTLFWLKRLCAEKLEDLGVVDRQVQHLSYCVRGERHPVRLPPIPMYLDAQISTDLIGGLEPKVGDKHVRMIAIDGFPIESYPGILATLGTLPIELRWSNRLILMEPHEAKKFFERLWRKWRQKIRGFIDQMFNTNRGVVNLDAKNMTDDAQSAMSEADRGQVRFGFYTSVVVVMHTERSMVDQWAREVRRTIQNLGFGARIETLNAVEAWLGTLPGHSQPNLRRPCLHSLNISDFLPLSSVWSGEPYNPCKYYPPKSPPLFYTYTTGETPYRFNLHVSDVGNSLVVGPTGAGKSTLLGLIVSQFFRYPNAQVFVFDKGRSLLPLTYAAGGHHYELGGETDTLQFCPLQTLDTPSDILWATGYLEQLVQLRNLTLTPKLSGQIARAVQLMAQQQPPGESLTLAKHPVGRSLTDFCATVQNQALREALRHYTLEGPLGGLLDAEHDNLSMDRFVTFELADLMRLGRATVVPLLLYLFRRITQRLQGQPTLILCDEAWVMLMDALFGGMFEEWLRTVRKLVGAVVLSTQNIGDLLKSPFANVIIESCPTRVLLPNPEATNTASRPFYEALGLTENQIETIRLACPKRDYFYTSPLGRRLFDLRLGPAALSFIGATGSDDIAAIQACMDREGEDWPAAWLRERGLSMQANQWEQLAYVSEQDARGGASRAVSA